MTNLAAPIGYMEEDTPLRGHSSKTIFATVPPCFNRTDRSKWEVFINHLINYFWAYSSDFDLEKKKVGLPLPCGDKVHVCQLLDVLVFECLLELIDQELNSIICSELSE
jgi:hypothetical protein